MKIILLAVILIVIAAFEFPGLVKKKMWRELAAFSVLLLIGAALSFGQALKLPLPNPTRGIEAVFVPVSRFIDKLLT
jgi:predicted tellurium resistance membrane protein TerC